MKNSVRRATIAARGLAALLACFLLANCSFNPQKEKKAYLESAVRYMKKHDYQAAAIQCKNALKVDPRFADAFFQLGLANEAQQNWAEAYKNYNQAAELAPQRTDVRLKLAQIEILTAEYTRAQDVLSSIVKQDPNNGSAYALLGACKLARKQPQAARDALTRAAQLLPKSASVRTDLGLVEVTLRQFATAEQHLKEAINLNPHDPNGYSNLANLYKLLGDPRKEAEAFDQGIQQNPDTERLYLAAADMLDAQGKHAEAAEVLERLAARKPKSAVTSLAIGDYDLARNEMPEALSRYQHALELAPRDTSAMDRMVTWDLSNGKLKDADTLNAAVLKQQPGDADAGLARAQILLEEGKVQDAILRLRKEITEQGDAPLPHHLLALAQWRQQNLADAKNEFRSALRFDPAYLPSERGLTELLLSTNDISAARDVASGLVRQHPGDLTGRMLLSTINLRLGNMAGARANAAAAHEIAPKDPRPTVNLALADAAEKRWAQAEAEFQTAVAFDPHSLATITEFTAYWMRRGQPDRAIALARQLVNSSPGDAGAHLLLGSLALQTKQDNLAAAELEQATQLAPKLVQAHTMLGQLYQNQNMTPQAIQQYEAALALQPKSAFLESVLGNLYSNIGKTDAAKHHYLSALAIDPNYGPAAGNLAWLEAQSGDNLDVALSLAERAKQAMPDPAPITDTLAWIQYKKGVYASAVPLFEECVKKAPSSPIYHYHLGLALLASGQKGEGRAQLEAALRLKLAGDDAKNARQTLGRRN